MRTQRMQQDVSVFLSKVFNVLPVPAVVFSGSGKLKPTANAEARKLFGLHLAPLVRNQFVYLVGGKPRAYPHKELPWIIALTRGTGARKEDMVLEREGKRKLLRAFAMPVLDAKNVTGAVAVFEDITDARGLEDELYMRTVKLEIANEHLKELDRMKTEFVSLASHQLKTPLTAIRWFLELVVEGDAGALAPKQREYLLDAKKAVLQLVELMNFLLNISRIETGKIGISPRATDVEEFVKGVIREAEPLFASRAQECTFVSSGRIGVIPLDEKLVREILLNLLSNAAKYTPAAGSAQVLLTKEKQYVRCEVKDTGYGIPKTETRHVFEKFFRGSNVVHYEAEGTGLGLYLARALAELCGGQMQFTSEEGKGTSFFFTLPVAGPASRAGEKPLAEFPKLIPTYIKDNKVTG